MENNHLNWGWRRGAVFTYRALAQLLEGDSLSDIPSLCFEHEGYHGVIQTSHVHSGELVRNPQFARSSWEYERTTREWIPCFRYVGAVAITELCDLTLCSDRLFPERGSSWWATPKGHTRGLSDYQIVVGIAQHRAE